MDLHASLWSTTLVMAGGGLAILLTGKRRTPSEGLDTVFHGIMPPTTAFSCFAAATGQGVFTLPHMLLDAWAARRERRAARSIGTRGCERVPQGERPACDGG